MITKTRASTNDPWLDRAARREDPACWSNASPEGVVVSAHYKASQAGTEILSAGGNAIDAAIATSLSPKEQPV